MAKGETKMLTWPLFLLTLISSLGSFQHGYNLWIVSDPVLLREDFYNGTDQGRNSTNSRSLSFLLGLAAAMCPLGGILGSLLFSLLVDMYGRKGTLLLNDLLNMASVSLLGCSKLVHSHAITIVSRLTTGICTGIFANVVPMYLGETSPLNLRGAISMVPMLFFSFGVVTAQHLGLHKLQRNEKGLPVLMSLTWFVSLFQIMLLLPFPESPRYLLVQKEYRDSARQALKCLRHCDDVEDEMEELHQEALYEKEEKEMSVAKLLCFKDLRWQLLSTAILMVGQQFSGINAVQYYADRIYNSTGVGENNVWSIGLGSTFVCIFTHIFLIYAVDFWGRRVLLLTGFKICIISCVMLTTSLKLKNTISWMPYVSTIFVFIFYIGYIIGPSSIPNLIITELFLQSSRSSAYAIGGSVHWFCNFLVGFVFLHVEKNTWPYGFLVFLPFSAASFFYIFKSLPETKKKTFLHIRRIMEMHLAKEQTAS